jgi:hypothetical protein
MSEVVVCDVKHGENEKEEEEMSGDDGICCGVTKNENVYIYIYMHGRQLLPPSDPSEVVSDD